MRDRRGSSLSQFLVLRVGEVAIYLTGSPQGGEQHNATLAAVGRAVASARG
jgi:hypothetical protein